MAGARARSRMNAAIAIRRGSARDRAFVLDLGKRVAPTSVSSSPWCVTAPGGTGRLTISACTGTGGQVVKKEGAHYVFTGTGDVMDLKAASTANGNAVIAYPQNGGKNQQWSLP